MFGKQQGDFVSVQHPELGVGIKVEVNETIRITI